MLYQKITINHEAPLHYKSLDTVYLEFPIKNTKKKKKKKTFKNMRFKTQNETITLIKTL